MKNEIILNCSFKDFEQFIKETVGKLEYDDYGVTIPLIVKHSKPFDIDDLNDISFEGESSAFQYITSENKVIINPVINNSCEQIDMDKSFFEGLSKLTNENFSVCFLNGDIWEVVFCVKKEDELLFGNTHIDEWEDPDSFEEFPYFEKLAIEKKLKKVEDEYGDKVYSSDDIYEIIYDFRNNLLSNPLKYAEKIAPHWYEVKMK